ncbi:MAG: extracellular solute-binding protein [Clostridia bacterium]|nr:extracellular solute-binding protein [Clostridia bacterium]
MKFKKALALGISAALIVTAFAACGTQEAVIDWESVKIVEEPVTLTYWVRNDMSASVSNYAENAAYKELARRTNVNIEFLHPSGDQNQLEMLIAADSLPDIVETVGVNGLPDGGDECIETNVIIRLNELIDEYAPNFKAAREADDESRQLTITDKGNIYAFPKLLDGEELAWSGPSVREDLLEKLNLDVPETIDDWYEMLTAFKQDGVPIPLTIGHNGWDTTSEFGVFMGSFGVNRKFILDEEGNVAYGPIMDGYREFLQTFHKWYEEGLLDPEFNSREDKGDQAAAGNVGAAVQTSFGEYVTVAAPYPKRSEDSDVPNFRQKNWRNRGYEASITTKCSPENQIIAVKWFDYHYDQSLKGGARLFDWGIESVDGSEGSYTMQKSSLIDEACRTLSAFYGKMPDKYDEEGYPVATQIILDDPLGYWGGLNKYKVDNAPYYKDVDRVLARSEDEVVNEKYMVWSQANATQMLPNYTMTDEEKVENKEIMDAVSSYVSSMYVSFIKGEESLDKWDEYVATVKQMGIDRATQINQDAYSRLKAR